LIDFCTFSKKDFSSNYLLLNYSNIFENNEIMLPESLVYLLTKVFEIVFNIVNFLWGIIFSE